MFAPGNGVILLEKKTETNRVFICEIVHVHLGTTGYSYDKKRKGNYAHEWIIALPDEEANKWKTNHDWLFVSG